MKNGKNAARRPGDLTPGGTEYAVASRPSRTSTRMAMVRARLNLPTIRRASGMFEGNHASIFTGHGHDFEDLIEYHHGDDVGDIDWKSSARSGRPIIRRFERESDVFTQLVVDTGIEMRGSTPSGERKSDVLMLAADLLGYLATHRGDRLGLVFGDSTGVERTPARHGNHHLEFTLNRIEEKFAASRGFSSVSAMLEQVLRLPQSRSLLIVLTDEYWPANESDHQALRRIRTKHELLVVRVMDMPMTQAGIARMADVDGQVIPAYLRDDEQLRKEISGRRQAARAYAESILKAHGVWHGLVASTDDVVPVLFDLLRRQHRG